MSDFKIQCGSRTDAEVLRYADDLERMIGEVMSGQRKAAHLPVEYMAVLIQFARDRATPAQSSTDQPLTRCAAARDGDCTHVQCPQLRDGEPAKTGRHCPLDTSTDQQG